MPAPQFDPVLEKAMLSSAISALEHAWAKPDMAPAVAALRAALAHAEHALAVLEQEPARDTAFAVHVLGLDLQVTYARAELEQAEQITGRTREETPEALDTIFPAGTTVACPRCNKGLYKTTTRVTVRDLVHDDGTLLAPRNHTISPRYP